MNKQCIIPGCKRDRASKGRRSKGSPLYTLDKSIRYSFCRYHLKGKGKAERIAFQKSRVN